MSSSMKAKNWRILPTTNSTLRTSATTNFTSGADVVRDCDLLIHDAQYVHQDMPMKSGWGHSLAEEAVKLAIAANVKQLALYSHDHIRTDDEIDKIDEECQQLIQAIGSKLICYPSREGQVVEL